MKNFTFKGMSERELGYMLGFLLAWLVLWVGIGGIFLGQVYFTYNGIRV